MHCGTPTTRKKKVREEGCGVVCKQMCDDLGLNRGKEREGPGLQG